MFSGYCPAQLQSVLKLMELQCLSTTKITKITKIQGRGAHALKPPLLLNINLC